MKRALIITYYWPPSGGAGVQRWLKFVKYLPSFSWEPVVYTPENPEVPVLDYSLESDIPEGIQIIRQKIREPYSMYKFFLGQKKEDKIQAAFLSEKKKNKLAENIAVWIRGNFFIPDARKFFITPSVKFLEQELKLNPVDLIISTGPPHSMHLIAMKTAEKTGIPWLADFRDPWTGIDFFNDLKLTPWARLRHHRLEKEVLEKASVVTVISPSMAKEFARIFPRIYEVITNGFDEEDTPAGKLPGPDKKFSLAHIGSLTPSRNSNLLWKVIGEMVKEDPDLKRDLEIKLVGKVDHMVKISLQNEGLQEFVKQQDYLPHKDVLEVQRSAQVLLLLINNTPNAASILTGKIFEYLASGRPVFAIGPPDGDAASILNESKAGRIAGFTEEAMIREILSDYYNKYKEGTLRAEGKDISKFSRKNLTSKMTRVMEELLKTVK